MNTPSDVHIQTMWECYDYGGEWVNADATLDNIFSGMQTMFEIITTEGWKDVMFTAVDARGWRLTPEEDFSPSQQIFFVLFMVLGGLFMLNLFVGVVIDNFNLEKEKIHRKDMLTKLQIEYAGTINNCYEARPVKIYVSRGNKIEDFFRAVVENPVFDRTISICIVVNTLSLGITWYD